jgi:hypothetical protein
MLSTTQKIKIARLLSRTIIFIRNLFGKSARVITERDGIIWDLDLCEGIDLAIYIFGGFELETIKFYKANIVQGSIILDIGANIGAHTLPFALLTGDQGMVYSFEPTEYAFNKQINK